MRIKLRISYIIMLFSSILFYAVPFEYGGNIVRAATALVVIGFSIYSIRMVWQDFKSIDRFNIAILLINSLAALHFSLIFLTVVIEVSHLWLLIAGLVIGTIIFFIVQNRMKNY